MQCVISCCGPHSSISYCAINCSCCVHLRRAQGDVVLHNCITCNKVVQHLTACCVHCSTLLDKMVDQQYTILTNQHYQYIVHVINCYMSWCKFTYDPVHAFYTTTYCDAFANCSSACDLRPAAGLSYEQHQMTGYPQQASLITGQQWQQDIVIRDAC